MWILYIIGGLIAICILWVTGILPAFLVFVAMCLTCGFVGGIIGLFCGDGDTGASIGVIVGLVLFIISCIASIVNPDETVFDFFTDGKVEVKHISSRGEGIAGLVMLGILATIILITG